MLTEEIPPQANPIAVLDKRLYLTKATTKDLDAN